MTNYGPRQTAAPIAGLMSQARLLEIVEAAGQKNGRLSTWEQNFMQSMARLVATHESRAAERLSERQIDTLRSIERKVFAIG